MVDGVIGSGKSTTVDVSEKKIRTLPSALSRKIAFVREPVDQFLNWMGHEPLALTEQDPIKHSKMTQIHIIRTLASVYREELAKYGDYDLIVCDRYMNSVRMFTDNLLEMGYITPFDREVILAVLLDYEALLQPLNHTVYLRRSPSGACSTWTLRGTSDL